MIVCNASYIPSSTIGKTNLIIMMILILVKLLSNIFFWWFSGFLVVRWIVICIDHRNSSSNLSVFNLLK